MYSANVAGRHCSLRPRTRCVIFCSTLGSTIRPEASCERVFPRRSGAVGRSLTRDALGSTIRDDILEGWSRGPTLGRGVEGPTGRCRRRTKAESMRYGMGPRLADGVAGGHRVMEGRSAHEGAHGHGQSRDLPEISNRLPQALASPLRSACRACPCPRPSCSRPPGPVPGLPRPRSRWPAGSSECRRGHG